MVWDLFDLLVLRMLLRGVDIDYCGSVFTFGKKMALVVRKLVLVFQSILIEYPNLSWLRALLHISFSYLILV